MMEDKGNDANAARVRNDEAFEAASLSDARASWQRERWGDTMADHGEDLAGDGEAGEGERGEGGDSMGGRSTTMTTSTSLPLLSSPPP
jgi:hypothetical protein